jgi:hypothetical protein
MSDANNLAKSLRERLSVNTEERMGKALSDLLENPLITGAIGRAFDAREKASQAQEVAMGALNIPSAADIERLTRRLRAVSHRLEGIEDGVQRLDRALSPSGVESRLSAIEDQLGKLTGKLRTEVVRPARAAAAAAKPTRSKSTKAKPTKAKVKTKAKAKPAKAASKAKATSTKTAAKKTATKAKAKVVTKAKAAKKTATKAKAKVATKAKAAGKAASKAKTAASRSKAASKAGKASAAKAKTTRAGKAKRATTKPTKAKAKARRS